MMYRSFDSYFLDMMYVEFMKNFPLADSNELMVRLFLTHFGLLSPKTFHSYFLDMMYVEFMQKFFSSIRASWWQLDSFRPPEPKNVWFLLSRHDVRRVHQKFSSRRFDELMAVRLISAPWAIRSWTTMMAVRLISASWAQKRSIPTF